MRKNLPLGLNPEVFFHISNISRSNARNIGVSQLGIIYSLDDSIALMKYFEKFGAINSFKLSRCPESSAYLNWGRVGFRHVSDMQRLLQQPVHSVEFPQRPVDIQEGKRYLKRVFDVTVRMQSYPKDTSYEIQNPTRFLEISFNGFAALHEQLQRKKEEMDMIKSQAKKEKKLKQLQSKTDEEKTNTRVSIENLAAKSEILSETTDATKTPLVEDIGGNASTENETQKELVKQNLDTVSADVSTSIEDLNVEIVNVENKDVKKSEKKAEEIFSKDITLKLEDIESSAAPAKKESPEIERLDIDAEQTIAEKEVSNPELNKSTAVSSVDYLMSGSLVDTMKTPKKFLNRLPKSRSMSSEESIQSTEENAIDEKAMTTKSRNLSLKEIWIKLRAGKEDTS